MKEQIIEKHEHYIKLLIKYNVIFQPEIIEALNFSLHQIRNKIYLEKKSTSNKT